MEKRNVQIEELVPNLRWFYFYEDTTPRDERIIVEFTRCENTGSKSCLPALWYKHGHTPTELPDWWSVRVYVCEAEGDCYGRYNPTDKLDERINRHVIDFDWILPATEANREKLLREIERRAFKEDA